jgi:phosphonate transport system substrate-binding protein
MKWNWKALLLLAMIAAACRNSPSTPIATTSAPTAETTATNVEVATTPPAEPELGTADKPIEILLVPSADPDVIVSSGEVLAAGLEEATGLVFDVPETTSYAATIEEMCANPDRSLGFIPGLGYVLANDLCGVDVAFKAVRFGYDVYWSQFLVQRGSEIDSLDDLAGLSWAYPDPGSTSGYLVPLLELQETGVEPGATFEAGGHRQAALAVYRGDADFATTFYNPPLLPEGEWSEGDEADIPEEALAQCGVTPDDELWCGDYRVLDARASARAEAPDIVQKVRILTMSQGIPNETISFGPDFPPDIRARIEEAMVAFAETPEWKRSIGNPDFYAWTGISPANDAEYDVLRMIVDMVGIGLDNI